MIDREGVALAAKALLADQRLKAMSGTNMPKVSSDPALFPARIPLAESGLPLLPRCKHAFRGTNTHPFTEGTCCGRPQAVSEGGEARINPFVLVTAREGALPKRGGIAGVLPAMEGYDVEEIKREGERLLADAGLSSSVTVAMAR